MNFLHPRARSSATVLSLTLAVTSCGDSGSSTTAGSASETAADSDSGTTGATDDATSNDTTGSAPTGTASQTGTTSAGTTSAGTTSAGTTSAGTTSADTTTGAETTGGGKDSCLAACEKLVRCEPDHPLDECLEECAPPPDASVECLDALETLTQCITRASCDDLAEVACIEEGVEYEELCDGGFETGGQECAIGGEGDMSGCKFSIECPDESLSMQCSEDKCSCFANGEPDGECQIPGVCSGDKDALDLLLECCDYEP